MEAFLQKQAEQSEESGAKMSYQRTNPYERPGVPYGMQAGVPVAGVAGMPGMPAMQGVAGMRVAGMPTMAMNGLYATEKVGLYQTGAPTYQIPQGYYAPANTGQASYLAASPYPQAAAAGYLTAPNPAAQRYMVPSQAYAGSGTPGYSPAGYSPTGYYTLPAGYTSITSPSSTLGVQPSTLGLTSTVPTVTSSTGPTQSQYPTYIGTQLGPMQLSPSQSPYAAAAAATGHPLYPGSPIGLQMQPAQVQQSQLSARMGAPTATGLPAGMAYPAHASSPTLPASYLPTI